MATATRATKSGNPATAAAAKKAAIEAEAKAREEKDAARAKALEEFKTMVLPEPVLDDDGYEVIPDKTTLAGGSYKFKLGGQAFVLPNLQYLPVGLAMKFNTMSEQDAQAAIFGRYIPGVFDVASADQLMHIMKRWTEYSQGVGLGE